MNRSPATRNPQSKIPSRKSLFLVVLFLLALLPRFQAPGDFVTVDEIIHWFKRSENFVAALQQGDYAATNMTGHPGVTTMWLGTLGIQLHGALVDAGLATTAPDRFYNPDKTMEELYISNAFYRGTLRMPVAVVTALSVVLAFLLLLRLYGWRVAVLAALFMATDPFLVAHGQLLHVDALLTAFVTLAVLAALAAFPLHRSATPAEEQHGTLHWHLLIGSAVAGGLAFATKSPAIVLPPVIGLTALLGTARHHAPPPERGLGAWGVRVVLQAAALLLLWCGMVAVLWVALWPAAWVAPGDAVMTVVNEVIENGAQPHRWGNFYMGQVVGDPGALYYSVALVLRLTPWALVGILAAALPIGRQSAAWQRHSINTVLLTFVLLFVLMMLLASKKQDRYLLPIFPVLNIIAALGWLKLFSVGWAWLRQRTAAPAAHREPQAWGGVCLLFLLIGVLNLAWYHPYELAYYNPLVGGGPAAAEAILVGWGEGSEQAGAYIAAQPDGCERPVATRYAWVLVPYTCHDVMPLEWIEVPTMNNYAVMYINQIQRDNNSETFALLRDVPPVHTVRIHGIDYVQIYQLVPERGYALKATFGDALFLDSYILDSSTLPDDTTLKLFLQWQARGTIDEPYSLFIHVLDAQGRRVAQVDVPPPGPAGPPPPGPAGGGGRGAGGGGGGGGPPPPARLPPPPRGSRAATTPSRTRCRCRPTCPPAPTGLPWVSTSRRMARACRCTMHPCSRALPMAAMMRCCCPPSRCRSGARHASPLHTAPPRDFLKKPTLEGGVSWVFLLYVQVMS